MGILAPLAWLVVLALRPGADMTVWATLWDSLENVWAQGFGNAIVTSLWLALVVAALTAVITIPAGFALATCGRAVLRRVAAILLSLGAVHAFR